MASSALLDERSVVEQQREPVAHEQLALTLELLALLVEIALAGPLGRGPELVVHDVGHARSKRARTQVPMRSYASDAAGCMWFMNPWTWPG